MTTHTHSRLSAHTHTCLLRHTQTPTHTHMHTHHTHTDMHTRAHGFPRTGTCTHIHVDQQPAAFRLPHKVPLLAQVEGGNSLPVSTDPQSQQRPPEYVTLHISEARRGGPGHRWGHHTAKPPSMLKRTPQAVVGMGQHSRGSGWVSSSATPLLTEVVALVVLAQGLGEDPASPRLPPDAGPSSLTNCWGHGGTGSQG